MRVDHSLVLPIDEHDDGHYRVMGWIKADPSTKVMIRFETPAGKFNEVEGLFRTRAGGWYRYLPSTGNAEFFEVEVDLDLKEFGRPRVSIDRWAGEGDIELFVEGVTDKPKLLFWGSKPSFEALAQGLSNPAERFVYETTFASAGAPKSRTLLEDPRIPQNILRTRNSMMADFSKKSVELVNDYHYDLLVLDVESLAVPIVRVHNTVVEDTGQVRQFRIVPAKTQPVAPGDDDYASIFVASMRAVLHAARPRPVARFQRDSVGPDAAVKESEALLGLNQQALDDLVGMLNNQIEGIVAMTAEDIAVRMDSFESWLGGENPSVAILDPSHELAREKPDVWETEGSTRSIISSPLCVGAEAMVKFGTFLRHFTVRFDLLATEQVNEKSVLLSLDLVDLDGESVQANLGEWGIWKSQNSRIGYFRYTQSQPGLRGYYEEISLPPEVFCRGVRFVPFDEEAKNTIVTSLVVEVEDPAMWTPRIQNPSTGVR